MNEDVLREFLVSLGFVVEESSFKKFNLAVESVTKGVMQAGLAVAATAAGIVAGVKVISSQMENLYYASQRTGATVGNLMALRYAAGQIGLTADQAQSSLEGFTRTLRLNPGTDNLLSSLGVTGKDPTEKFDSFIDKMKGMQPYVAAAYAGLFGIDPDTLLMLEQGLPKLEAEEAKYKDRLGKFGIDPDQAARAGVDFNNSIRSVKDTFNDLWIVIESKLAPVLTPLVNEFEKFAENHAAEVAQGIADAVQSLANWIQSVNWKKVGDDIASVYHAIGGLKGVLIAMAAIQLMPLVTGILSLTSAVIGLGGASSALGASGSLALLGRLGIAGLASYAGLKVAGALGLPDVNDDRGKKDVAHGDWLSASAHMSAGDFLATVWDKLRGAKTSDVFGSITGPGSSSPADHVAQGVVHDESGVPVDHANAPRGIRNNNPGNIEYGSFARGAGATGSDGRFAVFASMQEGMQATEKLLQGYIARGYDTIRTIISRWAPGSENNTSAYIADVAKKLGLSADQHVSGAQAGDIAKAIFSHENGSAYASIGNSNARLGVNGTNSNRSVSVSQTNTFHIAGTSDPQGTARAVAGEQYRLYGDMVRNFSGAVQ